MWKNLPEEEQKKYLQKWIKETIKKDETQKSLKEHIIRHAKEIFEKDPKEWSASMRNLIDAFDELYNSHPTTRLRLKKLHDKYKKNPNRYTPHQNFKQHN